MVYDLKVQDMTMPHDSIEMPELVWVLATGYPWASQSSLQVNLSWQEAHLPVELLAAMGRQLLIFRFAGD